MTHLIAPRRGEVLSNRGIGTTRLMEYLERMTDTVNDQADTDDTENTISASPAALSALMKEVNDIQLELATVGANSVMLAAVFKKLADIEIDTASIGTDKAAIAAIGSSTFDRRYALLVC